MTGEGRKAADVLAQARRAWSPSAADHERVRRAIGAALATGAAGAAGPTSVPRAAGWGARLLVAGTIASASGGIGYWAGHRAGLREAPASASVTAVAPTTTPPTPGPLGPPSSPEAPPLAPPLPLASHHGGHPAHHQSESSAPAESLAVEVRALRNAERALRDGNPGLALAFLEELDRQVPNGQLTEERDAAATLARCARGDRPIGVDLAGDFAERHPKSVYLARVDETCGATDSRTPGDSARRRPDQ
jgi:hypothetical protein